MKKAAVSLLLVLTVSIINAQQKFLAGYIITTDTITGEIRSFNPDRTPGKIEFRKNTQTVVYTPERIKGFGFSGDQGSYVSATVSYQTNPADYRNAKEEFSNEIRTETVFLRQLVKGNISLYQLILPEREYFFSERNGLLKELIYRVKIVNEQIVNDEQFKNQITLYASEMNQLSSLLQRISSLSYSEESLTRVFLLLNNSSIRLPNKKKPAIYLTGGFASCSFQNGGETYLTGPTMNSFLYQAHFDNTYEPQIGVEIAVLRRRVSLFFGLQYQPLSYHGEVENVSSFKKQSFDADLNLLTPTASLEYPFNKGKAVEFYTGVQLGSSILLNRSSTKSIFIHNSAGTFEINGQPTLQGGFITYGAYAGVSIGRVKLDALIVQSANILDVPAYLKCLAVGLRGRYLVTRP
jgi:hypothetical protein